MKKLLAVISTVFTITVYSQSVIGTWKRTSTTLEYQNGKKEDMQKAMRANLPCVVNTKYFFKADGTHYSQSIKGCEMIDQMGFATWKQTGNTLIIAAKKEANLNATATSYIISFSGNTMTLTHVYTDAENKGTNNKVKQIVTLYQRF